MLDDPDLIELLQDSSGIQAYSVFCLLLMAAKVQDNGGTFNHSTAVIAAMVRLPVEAFKVGLATLLSRTDWIIADANTVTIRSYKKWNSWGGARDKAGRKPSANQDAIKPQPKVDVPVSVSVSNTTTTLTPPATPEPSKIKRRSWAGDWEPTIAKMFMGETTVADRCKLLNGWAGIAGKPATENLIRNLEARNFRFKDIHHAHAYGTSALSASVKPEAQPKVTGKYQRGYDAYGD